MSLINARIYFVDALPEHDKVMLPDPVLVSVDPTLVKEGVLYKDASADGVKAERNVSDHSVVWGTQT